MTKRDQFPILIGVGQIKNDWPLNAAGEACSDEAHSPLSLCVNASKLALADTGRSQIVAELIDVVVAVRNNADSISFSQYPFGRCENPPGTIAAKLGLSPERVIYSGVGGNTPQTLVNEFSALLYEGKSRVVLLTGSEAIKTNKAALKKRIKLDWSESVSGDFEDREIGKSLLSEYEIANGLGFPTQTYPALEQAYRARMGLSRADYVDRMSALFESFSAVAEKNPYSQFPVKRSANFLSTPSKENYRIAEPYLKWHVAQDAVNQGAAVILTTVGQARKMGIAENKWVYLHGHADAEDLDVTKRPDLSRSPAIEKVLNHTLKTSGCSSADIDLFDIYSCFPVVVELAMETLGIDYTQKPMTVTGGLPYFGGAGNNYSMHAIATMTELLRQAPEKLGLIMANGGFASKEAAGVYSVSAPKTWKPTDNTKIQHKLDTQKTPVLLNETTDAIIESYTVAHGRSAPSRAYVIARTEKGRILARCRRGHRATMAALAGGEDPIGKTVSIRHQDGKNYFLPNDKLGIAPKSDFLIREFKHITVERRGHVLEVTINRPKTMNSLHSAANFELSEIWDDFEADDDLWVAILTGAGDKAFCAGNDLSVTAKGGDMTTPQTGFAGLCNRHSREKPIICAVNGVAMGGGLEIVLACDLAVAEDHSRMALPEVKVGLFAGAGGVQRITRHIGRKAAMDLVLTGRTILADRALELGLVNEVCPQGQALMRARVLADEIVTVSPSAVKASKATLNRLDEINDDQEGS